MAAYKTFALLRPLSQAVNRVVVGSKTILRGPLCSLHCTRLLSASACLKSELRYTTTHEWVDVDGDVGTVGISNYAQEQLGDVVYVELPEIGLEVTKGGDASTIESVKAASDIFAPVGGTVTEVNEALTDKPALINKDPFKQGWIFKMTLADKEELRDLMDEESYKTFVDTSGH